MRILNQSSVLALTLAAALMSSGTWADNASPIGHNEVGYTMPTWPRNLTDGERKVAGAKAILRDLADGIHLLGPDRDETIPLQQGYVGGYRRVLIECFARLDAGEPPPITAQDCARAVTLIHDAYRLARFEPSGN